MTAWVEAVAKNDIDALLKGFDQVQLLLSDSTTYAIGDEFTIADISVGPWIERIVLLLEKDFFGKYDKSTVARVFEAYKSSKYDKLRNWNRRVQERPSVKKTFLKVRLKCYRYVRVKLLIYALTKDTALQMYSARLSPKV